MPFLLIQRPDQDEERFTLPGQPLSVGRQSDNELVIDEDSLSRRHALITPDGEGHAIADQGSRNGVWVNGQRVTEAPVPLRDGDEVALGGRGVVLRYCDDEPTGTDATAFFSPVPAARPPTSEIMYEGERWMKVLRVTPWLRFVAAALGSAAAVLALTWWIIRFLG